MRLKEYINDQFDYPDEPHRKIPSKQEKIKIKKY